MTWHFTNSPAPQTCHPERSRRARPAGAKPAVSGRPMARTAL